MGDDAVYLSWNTANWITVFLMAFIGLTVLGAVTYFIKGNKDDVAE